VGKMWKKSILESKTLLHNAGCNEKSNHEPIQGSWPPKWELRLVLSTRANVLTLGLQKLVSTLDLLSVGSFVPCEDIHGP